MTRDDIIRMAREAGLFVPQAGVPENGALMRFAALVAAAEREACAQIADTAEPYCAADLIRKRGWIQPRGSLGEEV